MTALLEPPPEALEDMVLQAKYTVHPDVFATAHVATEHSAERTY